MTGLIINVPDGEAQPRTSFGEQALALAKSEWSLWHTQENGPSLGYATYQRAGHQESVALRSTAGRHALTSLIYKSLDRVPSRKELDDTLNSLEASAIFDGPYYRVHTRIADLGDKVYLDLANDAWQVVEISANGWKIINAEDAPIRFRRPNGTHALPSPLPGGDLFEIGKFINTDRIGLILSIAWLLDTLTDRGPHPILAYVGGHGTAKSTATSVLQRIVDPRASERRAPPRSNRDLAIAATNSWITGFDNISKLSPELADDLCRLSTGSAFTTRSLYSDGEEVIFTARRPVILNSIVDLTERPDLSDRTISIQLIPIDKHRRMVESQFWPLFEAARPGILGALLTALATALKTWSSIEPMALPRMADFYKLIQAAGPSLPWSIEEFESAWLDMRDNTIKDVIQGSALMVVLLPFLETVGAWRASASELLYQVNARHSFDSLPDEWPKTPQGLIGALRRLAPMFEHLGWDLKFGRRDNTVMRGRWVEISKKATIDPLGPKPAFIIDTPSTNLETPPLFIPVCKPQLSGQSVRD